MGKVVPGSRMVCSDSESTARSSGVVKVLLVAETAPRKKALRLMTGSCLRQATYVTPEYVVRCRQVGKVK